MFNEKAQIKPETKSNNQSNKIYTKRFFDQSTPYLSLVNSSKLGACENEGKILKGLYGALPKFNNHFGTL